MTKVLVLKKSLFKLINSNLGGSSEGLNQAAAAIYVLGLLRPPGATDVIV